MNRGALIFFILGLCVLAIAQDDRDDSWELGTNDSIPKTEVIIMDDCSCP